MEVAIPVVSDGFRPSTANTVLGSTGSSVFGAPTPPRAARPISRSYEGGSSARSQSARGGRRLAALSGSPRVPRGDAGAIVPVPRPGHMIGIPRQISSRGSSRGSARRSRLPGLGISSSSTELHWLSKVTPETAEELVKVHLTRQQRLNELSAQRRERQNRLDALKDEYMGTHHTNAIDQKVLDANKVRLSSLQLKLRKCTTNQKTAQKDTGKLTVMLRRTKKEWVGGMARMQDIGQYANDQVQGLFRGSQWRMYNEMLREVAAFKLTNLHAENTEMESRRQADIATRRKELETLDELEQMMRAEREQTLQERQMKDTKEIQNKAKTAHTQDAKLTVSELRRATLMMTKVEHAVEQLSRRGHRFPDVDEPGRTVLDAMLDQLQHQQKLCVEAKRAKMEGAEKLNVLTARLESLEGHLTRAAFPTETPEPDMDERGNLSPRALGHGGSMRTLQVRQQELQRQLNARNLLLPAMETRATNVIQWCKRQTPKLERFDVYRKTLDVEVKAMTPMGIDITPANEVICWLKSIEATLAWLKAEVKRCRNELGRGELDWQEFNAHGLAAADEGKVVCVDPQANLRVLTEDQETERQKAYRLSQIADKTKADVARERADHHGNKPTCELL